ncbi:MAG: hypothetical protein KDA59_17810 [Planctomycetales bacterium]|nr:hypothetical protein [Planctomycetales bacterium]
MATAIEIGERRRAKTAIWWPVAAMFVAGLLVSGPLPPWGQMWVLAVAVYASLKWLTLARLLILLPASQRSGGDEIGLSMPSLAGYLFLWPGMDAPAFLLKKHSGPAPRLGQWLSAIAKTAVGATLIALAPSVVSWPGIVVVGWRLTGDFLAAWMTMIGVVFVLHFGAIHALALTWQRAGRAVEPIMRAPIMAQSLADFWGRRWNLAFRDFAHTFVFRPMLRRYGAAAATLGVFTFSGIVHDAVISVAARGGYGWPTLYFLLQGIAMLFERSGWGRRIGLGRGWRGRLYAAVVLVTPAGWLFHEPFRDQVVLPMMRAIASLG